MTPVCNMTFLSANIKNRFVHSCRHLHHEQQLSMQSF